MFPARTRRRIVQNTETNIDLSQALSTALKAARLGREVLLKYFGNLEHVEEKFQAGLVSEADKESESVMGAFLKKGFPQIEFLGEESFAAGSKVQWNVDHEGARWILDPLDGTTNYVHRFPIFCISLALEINGKIQVAVVDVPMLNETYTAIRGRGAFVNGRPLKISETKNLKDAFLATGFVAEHENIIAEQLKIFSDMVRKCRGVRRAGAAAYDLCLVARGVFDGYWERNIQPWDAAAGILLVEEAGGVSRTYRDELYHPYKNSIVVGSAALVKEMQAIMKPHIYPESN